MLVAKTATDALVKTLCGKGAPITYQVYAGQDHRGSVGASLADAERFADAVVAGKPSVNPTRVPEGLEDDRQLCPGGVMAV